MSVQLQPSPVLIENLTYILPFITALGEFSTVPEKKSSDIRTHIACIENSIEIRYAGINDPIPVAVRFKAWVCESSFAGIEGSDPAGGMEVCLL